MPKNSIIDSQFIAFFHRAVRRAGEFILQEAQSFTSSDIEVKAKNSLVSYVDKQAEKMLVHDLSALLPESGFITEEDTEDDRSHKYTWIIDPLDGTTNFLQGLPHYCVSVALSYEEEIVLGAVYDPVKDELFHAGLNHGAWLGDSKINCAHKKEISEAILVTGFPYDNRAGLDSHIQLLKHFLQEARGIRRYGSAALDLCYIACGRFDIYYEHQLNIWDLAAGALIASEAGAIVSDYAGSSKHLHSGQILACNSMLHDRVSATLLEFV